MGENIKIWRILSKIECSNALKTKVGRQNIRVISGSYWSQILTFGIVSFQNCKVWNYLLNILLPRFHKVINLFLFFFSFLKNFHCFEKCKKCKTITTNKNGNRKQRGKYSFENIFVMVSKPFSQCQEKG